MTVTAHVPPSLVLNIRLTDLFLYDYVEVRVTRMLCSECTCIFVFYARCEFNDRVASLFHCAGTRRNRCFVFYCSSRSMFLFGAANGIRRMLRSHFLSEYLLGGCLRWLDNIKYITISCCYTNC